MQIVSWIAKAYILGKNKKNKRVVKVKQLISSIFSQYICCCH